MTPTLTVRLACYSGRALGYIQRKIPFRYRPPATRRPMPYGECLCPAYPAPHDTRSVNCRWHQPITVHNDPRPPAGILYCAFGCTSQAVLSGLCRPCARSHYGDQP